jgi:VIT1/CCC1 family predicted Fe2+/Mn2+ transporter
MSEFPANAALLRQVSELVHDMSELMTREIALARAEMKLAISTAVNAGILFSAAGVFALLAGLMLLVGIVFLIASFGLALHWAFLIVAAVLALVAVACFVSARAKLEGGIAPERTVRQFQQSVQSAKELIR